MFFKSCCMELIQADDTRRLQSFHTSCQRQILGLNWQNHVKNVDMTDRTGLPNIADVIIIIIIISKRRQALFGHVVRLDAPISAHQTLYQVIATKGGQNGDELEKTSWASSKNLDTADRQRNTGQLETDVAECR